MKIRTSIAAVVALGEAALACHKGEPVSTTQTTSATLEKPALTDEDRAFITKVTQSGMLEVALGEHAARQASARDVRELGEAMVIHHSLAEEELRNLAASRGVSVPAEMDPDHRARYDKLAKLRGKKLDRGYADDVVSDHERDVNELEAAARDLKDPELRAWAAKTLPAFEGQLERARALARKPE